MKRVGLFISSLSEFYSAIAPLRDIASYTKYDPSLAVQMNDVAARCKKMLNSEDFSFFHSAIASVKELIRLQEYLQRLSIDKKVEYNSYLSNIDDPVSSDGITQKISESISKAATRLIISLQDTVNSLPIFLVESRGIFDTNKLIESPEMALPSDVIIWIEKNAPKAIVDLREAGKCLAFGLATASGFHQMRFIESVLFPYYEKLPKIIGTPDKLLENEKERNWGKYIEKLEKRQAKDSVIKFLRHLKNEYRNPLMHPEDSLTVEEANLLLGTVQSITNAIYSDMKERTLIEINNCNKKTSAIA